MKVNQRCRVYGHFLTEAGERRGMGGGGGGGGGRGEEFIQMQRV